MNYFLYDNDAWYDIKDEITGRYKLRNEDSLHYLRDPFQESVRAQQRHAQSGGGGDLIKQFGLV